MCAHSVLISVHLSTTVFVVVPHLSLTRLIRCQPFLFILCSVHHHHIFIDEDFFSLFNDFTLAMRTEIRIVSSKAKKSPLSIMVEKEKEKKKKIINLFESIMDDCYGALVFFVIKNLIFVCFDAAMLLVGFLE
ncbi:hypothetical protein ACKWTF_009502 [Chironomus riparius]